MGHCTLIPKIHFLNPSLSRPTLALLGPRDQFTYFHTNDHQCKLLSVSVSLQFVISGVAGVNSSSRLSFLCGSGNWFNLPYPRTSFTFCSSQSVCTTFGLSGLCLWTALGLLTLVHTWSQQTSARSSGTSPYLLLLTPSSTETLFHVHLTSDSSVLSVHQFPPGFTCLPSKFAG